MLFWFRGSKSDYSCTPHSFECVSCISGTYPRNTQPLKCPHRPLYETIPLLDTPYDMCARITRRYYTSHRIASHRIASHRIASHRIASHRIASHRIASHRIASHRIAYMSRSPGSRTYYVNSNFQYMQYTFTGMLEMRPQDLMSYICSTQLCYESVFNAVLDAMPQLLLHALPNSGVQTYIYI